MSTPAEREELARWYEFQSGKPWNSKEDRARYAATAAALREPVLHPPEGFYGLMNLGAIQPARAEDRQMASLGEVYAERDALRAEVKRLQYGVPHPQCAEVDEEVRELRTRAERAEAEVALMRPVVDAAVEFCAEDRSATWRALNRAVEDYVAPKAKP